MPWPIVPAPITPIVSIVCGSPAAFKALPNSPVFRAYLDCNAVSPGSTTSVSVVILYAQSKRLYCYAFSGNILRLRRKDRTTLNEQTNAPPERGYHGFRAGGLDRSHLFSAS